MFDTIGTVIGVADKANLLDKDGKLPRVGRVLMADAVGTVVGSMMGTSTITSFVESSAGVAEGGKTGLTALTTGFMFLVALFLSPIFLAIPAFATAPALIIVGFFMASSIKKMHFEGDTADCVGGYALFLSPIFLAIPAFATAPALIIVGFFMASSIKKMHFEGDTADCVGGYLAFLIMPLTYSIANGIMFGVLAWFGIKVCTGQIKKIHPIMYVVCALFVFRVITMII